jgi:phosphoglycerol transferase MdoB-like AlkP superfamily enzyme
VISLTKGEGFGRPLLEFSLVKKPIITSNWSGHMDFLNPEFVVALNGELKNVHPSAANQFLIQDSQWFSPNHNEIGNSIKEVYDNYKKYNDGAKRQAYRSKTMFNFDEMKKLIGIYLEQYIPEFPNQVEIKLPTMNKISLPKKPVITNG